MPLKEETINIESEIERLTKEREKLADEVAAMDDENPKIQQKAQRGQEIDAHLDGLDWALTAHEDPNVPAWDEPVETITLGGLTGGEFGAMERDLADAADGQSVVGAQRVYQVQRGTVEAPFVDGGMSDREEIMAISSLPTGFLKWAEWRVDQLSSVGNSERRSFGELVAEKQVSE